MSGNEITLGIVFTTVLILLLIAAIFIVIILASRQRAKQETDLIAARLTYERELRTIESETREATLTHISTELHDNIGQLLTLTRLHIEKEQLINPQTEKSFSSVSTALHNATRQVRLLSHTLNTHFIADQGLLHSLSQEVERLQGLGKCTISFKNDVAEPLIRKDQQTVVFRMVQEILNNSLRHSRANNIYIALQSDPTFNLSITDDGIGFDREAVLENSQGLGLRNMDRRALMAGLECNIVTAPDRGCAYTISINHLS